MVEIMPSDGPGQFAYWKRSIERQIAAMTTARGTAYTDVYDQDGNLLMRLDASGFKTFTADGDMTLWAGASSLTIYDASGDLVGTLGEIDIFPLTGGQEVDHGIVIRDPETGVEVLKVTADRGVQRPVQQFEWRKPEDPTVVTSGTFETVYQAVPMWWPTTAVRASLAIVVGASTVGEVRLQVNHLDLGVINSGVQSLAANSNQYYTWRWDLASHGINIGTTFLFNVQVRRTSGSGNIWVHQPLPLRGWDTDTNGATPNGLDP